MAIVCAWCLAVLEVQSGSAKPAATSDPTHGICCKCRRKLEKRGTPFLGEREQKRSSKPEGD